MATTFRKVPEDNPIVKLVAKMRKANHAELEKNNATIDVILASREDKKLGECPALKANGLPVFATIKITSLQDRARGVADAKLVIDEYAWKKLADSRKAALIDHELHHLAVSKIRGTKRNGWSTGVKFDDLGRPCLKLRPHDWEIAGFKETAERHGEASIEAGQFMNFRADFGQLNLFGDSALEVAEKATRRRSREVMAGDEAS